MESYILNVDVAPADIDHMGHVNNAVYLRWIELAVHGHWTALATPPEFSAYLWVAVRHEIDYRSPAFIDDRLQLETRLESVRRARAWYRTTVKRADGVLVDALSCWCCLDAKKGSLTAIPPEISSRGMLSG